MNISPLRMAYRHSALALVDANKHAATSTRAVARYAPPASMTPNDWTTVSGAHACATPGGPLGRTMPAAPFPPSTCLPWRLRARALLPFLFPTHLSMAHGAALYFAHPTYPPRLLPPAPAATLARCHVSTAPRDGVYIAGHGCWAAAAGRETLPGARRASCGHNDAARTGDPRVNTCLRTLGHTLRATAERT